MARHIYIGAGSSSAANYTSGVLTNGEIDVQKMSSSGPTSLVTGDTVANAAQIRIVQGNGTNNIVSPWIYGRDVINWGGKSYVASSIDDVTYTVSALTATAAGEATIKVADKTNGLEPFTVKSWTVSYAIGATATTIADALKAEIIADPCDFAIEAQASTSNATLQFQGYALGVANGAGVVVTKPTILEVSFEDVNATDAARTVSGVAATYPSAGSGEGEIVREVEEAAMGHQYGYYNRIVQPNAPTTTAVAATNYDMWNIVATKDGSSASQIHGVDNLIDITIANTAGSGVNALDIENKLNAYFGSVGFATVTL